MTAPPGRAGAPTNLGTERTSFVGRAAMLEQLDSVLAGAAAPSLVTLIGAPGVGKTRTAKHFAAARVASNAYPGGVWFCDLAESRTLDDVLGAVAQGLGSALTSIADGASEIARTLVARGPALVLLDNFEQVASHAAATVGRWLEESPETVFVVTSRERLRIEGEIAIELPPLEPGEAVELLEQRALALSVRGEALGRPENAGVALKIVEAVDCLPLAIELAASRLTVLSPQQLFERLSQRMSVLGTARGPSARVATLRAAIDWSWELLSAQEQRALAQCSVFRGGFSLEAAEAVLDDGDVVVVLDALQGRSLLRSFDAQDSTSGDLRFGLYEVVREHASDKLDALGARAETETRHADYYLAKGELSSQSIYGPHGLSSLKWLMREYANLVAVHRRNVEARPDIAARAALALDPMMLTNGPFATYLELVTGALEAAQRTSDLGLIARARLARAGALFMRGDLAPARAEIDRGLDEAERAERSDLQIDALMTRGSLLARAGEMDASHVDLSRALGMARETGARLLEAHALGHLANVLEYQDRLREARDVKEQAIAVYRELRERRMEGILLTSHARLVAEQGELERADADARDALVIHRDTRNRLSEAITHSVLAGIQHERGDLDHAARDYEAAIALHRECGVRFWECEALSAYALLECERGELREAEHLGAQAVALARILDQPAILLTVWSRRAAIEAVRGHARDAQRALEQAERYVGEKRSDRSDVALVATRGLIETALAREAVQRDDPRERASHTRAAKENLDDAREREARAGGSLVGRLAIRLLGREVGRLPTVGKTPARAAVAAAPRTLVVGPTALWLELDGTRIDLERRHVLRRAIDVLIMARLQTPGTPLTLEQLFDRAWPGTRLDRASAANRVWVTLSTLRKLGLGDAVLTHEAGYLIDPEIRVVLHNDA